MKKFLRTTLVGGIMFLVPVALVLLALKHAMGFAARLARTQTGQRITRWFEESLLGGMPQYRMVKSMADGLTQVESGQGMQPALLRTDDGWQLAYRLEELRDADLGSAKEA